MIMLMKRPTMPAPGKLLSPSPTTQRGVALLLALVLLAVIAGASVVVARSAVFSDMVSKNLRSQALALQAAETALRYCEARLGTLAVFVLNDASIENEWQNTDNWDPENGLVNVVPDEFLGETVNYETAPECIIRRMSYEEAYGSVELPPDALKPEDRGLTSDYLFFFRITARGYSPDFERDASGNAISGGEAWVQSMMRGVL